MFTVRFFDVLTGVQAVSHPAPRHHKAANKAVSSKGLLRWFRG